MLGLPWSLEPFFKSHIWQCPNDSCHYWIDKDGFALSPQFQSRFLSILMWDAIVLFSYKYSKYLCTILLESEFPVQIFCQRIFLLAVFIEPFPSLLLDIELQVPLGQGQMLRHVPNSSEHLVDIRAWLASTKIYLAHQVLFNLLI